MKVVLKSGNDGGTVLLCLVVSLRRVHIYVWRAVESLGGTIIYLIMVIHFIQRHFL